MKPVTQCANFKINKKIMENIKVLVNKQPA